MAKNDDYAKYLLGNKNDNLRYPPEEKKSYPAYGFQDKAPQYDDLERILKSLGIRKDRANEIRERLEEQGFTPTGVTLGKGCWGVVEEFKDAAGQIWAIKIDSPSELAKKQAKDRKQLDDQKRLEKEAVPLEAAIYHIVPRIVGRGFSAMPRFDRDLEARLGDAKQLSPEEAVQVSTDIAVALAYMHTHLRKAHSDLKLDNILLNVEGRAFVTDMGTSTLVDPERRSENERSRMGCIYTRAPECFLKGSHPDARADVWAFGSMLYRTLTGKYILQDELDSAKDNPESVVYDKAKVEKLIAQRIKEVPRKFRKVIRNCLKYNASERYWDGEKLLAELKEETRTGPVMQFLQKHLKLLATAAASLAVLGITAYAGYVHEPKQLSLPAPRIHGELYLPGAAEERPIEFAREDITPETARAEGFMTNVDEVMIKRATENRVAACLLKTYHQTLRQNGVLMSEPVTSAQDAIWEAYASQGQKGITGTQLYGPAPYSHVAKAIEVALSKSKTPCGKVDLEDTLAIARLGEDKVNEARRAAGSFEFKRYIEAKDSAGNYIIPKNEKAFLKTWLDFTNIDYFYTDKGDNGSNPSVAKK